MAVDPLGKLGLTIEHTRCKYCGDITFVAGYDICEECAINDVHYVPISDVADVIVLMDQKAISKDDRIEYWKKYFITPMQVSAAEEEVEGRYKAAELKRNRSRRW